MDKTKNDTTDNVADSTTNDPVDTIANDNSHYNLHDHSHDVANSDDTAPITDEDTYIDVPVSREEVKAAFIKDRRAKTERLLATAGTRILHEMQVQIAASKEPLTEAAEDQFRAVARGFCDMDGTMDAAIRLAGQIEAHKGKVDPEIERGMRQALDTLLMAVAALQPQNQLTLIAKVQLLGSLGPAFADNVNLRAMLMAALQDDAIRLSRMDPVFEVIRTGPVH
jgi:hypothetical protein